MRGGIGKWRKRERRKGKRFARPMSNCFLRPWSVLVTDCLECLKPLEFFFIV